MRKIAPGVYLETKFPGVHLGALVSAGETLLLDTPVRLEDGHRWLEEVTALGRPRFLILLDHHPDRALGARGLDLPLVAHDVSGDRIGAWQDTFKGDAHPMGAEADRLKRATGVRRAIPELTFSQTIRLHVGEMEVELVHRPGPTSGSIWAIVPQAKVVFVGDCIWVGEPPYLGEADIPSWLEALAELRGKRWRGYRVISSRNGLVQGPAINTMLRTLRRLRGGMRRLGSGRPLSDEAVTALAAQLARPFRLPPGRKARALQRLQSGLADFQRRAGEGGG